MGNSVESYTKTYTAFSGCDIVASFNGKIVGELQGLTYSVSREKAPVYTLGSAEPRSFSRGKRGIAGSLVFTVFDRDALLEEFKPMLNGKDDTLGVQKFKANDTDFLKDQGFDSAFVSVDDWDAQMSSIAAGGSSQESRPQGKISDLVGKYEAKYADEILPFDITITFANEYGQKAVLVIYGVELLNEGSGYSIDTVTSEKAYTFVARRIESMKTLNDENDKFSSSF